MANSLSILLTCLLFLLVVLLPPSAINATRPAPASTDNSKKEKDCFGEYGSNGNVGFGRITGGTGVTTGRGSSAATSGNVPSFTDFDHSGPAAANARYIPGLDDTFVPNPGYEIPRSSGGGSPSILHSKEDCSKLEMAKATLINLFVFLLITFFFCTSVVADEKKEADCVEKQEGSVLIPGIGRYMPGSLRRPSITGLDHSGPAAAHARYLPVIIKNKLYDKYILIYLNITLEITHRYIYTFI
ncbi:hypothetical protein IEQ34_016430 [Dendrobium chrysotoxum]|uniref:Uncharacterized protein n=1 Tax=Dendrobium chrysotoxum TaxID=161865 RepID=A0AAV7GEJ1_DENCH|nr:hypothetical protein IEQ34_016430 [Dendrobium chrysotoxum]